MPMCSRDPMSHALIVDWAVPIRLANFAGLMSCFLISARMAWRTAWLNFTGALYAPCVAQTTDKSRWMNTLRVVRKK